MVQITLPDGSTKEYEEKVTVEDVAYDIGRRLGKDAVAGIVDGNKVDTYYEIDEDVELAIITIDSEEGLDILRHTASHIMAQAVKDLYDDVSIAIGPTIDDGFYYDFDLEESISKEDLDEIREKMQEIIDEDLPVRKFVLPKNEAVQLMKERNEPYKVELIEELDDEMISLYRQGDFVDLCRGPHLPRTGMVEAFELLNVAGAYWRGDENNEMLQRVYATAFADEKELEEYLKQREEAKKA